jgi:fimbrial chaperone protein
MTIFALPFLFAFKFHPMSQSIELSEKQKAVQFWLENDSEEKLGIELTVKERQMDEMGQETLPDTSEITIFPPQVIIPPKEKRAVRVSYSGSSDLKAEKSFRVIAEQLPVKVDEKTKRRSGIQMMMKYMAALYVTPQNADSSIEISSVETQATKLLVTVSNKGNKHQILVSPVLTINSSNTKHVLKEKDLQGFAGENVLANSKRTFTLFSFCFYLFLGPMRLPGQTRLMRPWSPCMKVKISMATSRLLLRTKNSYGWRNNHSLWPLKNISRRKLSRRFKVKERPSVLNTFLSYSSTILRM